ncbi:MAG TPA: hypothetical protein DEA32_00020, partial [Firmicutes bacterium]|nr:hypothetical protein [Bacillota bacterium]
MLSIYFVLSIIRISHLFLIFLTRIFAGGEQDYQLYKKTVSRVIWVQLFLSMVGDAGFEPATSWSRTK